MWIVEMDTIPNILPGIFKFVIKLIMLFNLLTASQQLEYFE